LKGKKEANKISRSTRSPIDSGIAPTMLMLLRSLFEQQSISNNEEKKKKEKKKERKRDETSALGMSERERKDKQ